MVGGQGPAVADRRPQEWAPWTLRLYAARVWLGSAPKPVSSSLGPRPFRLASTCWWGFKTWGPELDGLSRSTSRYHLVPSQIDQPAGPRWEGVQGCVCDPCEVVLQSISSVCTGGGMGDWCYACQPFIIPGTPPYFAYGETEVQREECPHTISGPFTSWFGLSSDLLVPTVTQSENSELCDKEIILDLSRSTPCSSFFSFACVYLIFNVFCTWSRIAKLIYESTSQLQN